MRTVSLSLVPDAEQEANAQGEDAHADQAINLRRQHIVSEPLEKPLQKRELHKEDCHGKEGHDEGQAGRDAEHRVGSSFPVADQLYTEAQVQAIFEDVDQHWTIARAFEPSLPAFPDLPINFYNLDNLRNCYIWAYGIVAIYGDAASLAIQGNLEKAIQRKDASAQQGWSNVQFGLMDMWRAQFPGETVH